MATRTHHAILVDSLGSSFPVTPGHQIAGRIDALGEHVADWAVSDRVAVG